MDAGVMPFCPELSGGQDTEKPKGLSLYLIQDYDGWLPAFALLIGAKCHEIKSRPGRTVQKGDVVVTDRG